MIKAKSPFAAIGTRAKNALGLNSSDLACSRGNESPAFKSTPTRTINDPNAFAASNLAALQAQNNALKAKLAAGPNEVSIAQLDEVPGRRRVMTPEQYAQLRESLRSFRQVERVTVQRRENGRFEIISGHHRVDALRELGHSVVPVVVVELVQEEIDRAVFCANAIRAPLNDYEMFRSFQLERSRDPSLSLAELGAGVGFDRRRVSELFAFERLPDAALGLLDLKPSAMGLTCANGLAKLTKAGHAGLVVQAVEMLVDGTLQQSKAVAWVRAQGVPRNEPASAESTRVLTFCSYTAKGKALRIEFRNQEERKVAEAAIDRCLRELAIATA